jgi:hypothetical protein
MADAPAPDERIRVGMVVEASPHVWGADYAEKVGSAKRYRGTVKARDSGEKLPIGCPAPLPDENVWLVSYEDDGKDWATPERFLSIVAPAKRPRDGSDDDAAQKKQKVADAIDLTEVASPSKEECVEAMNSVAREFICPITHELPIKPVTAEDGKIYEEKAIREWFLQKDGDPTSPSTGAEIGTRLLPAPQARNAIEALVKSGAIAGEIAEAWTTKLEQETKVKEMRAKAEGGDGQAMHLLGVWYRFGENGLAKDSAQARAWYERSAAARYPKGLASFGEYLLGGIGGPKDTTLGLVMVTQAAELGSDIGAYRLGKAFFKGGHGLSKDRVQARLWLKKIVDGECEYKHLNHAGRANAAKWLGELDE